MTFYFLVNWLSRLFKVKYDDSFSNMFQSLEKFENHIDMVILSYTTNERIFYSLANVLLEIKWKLSK